MDMDTNARKVWEKPELVELGLGMADVLNGLATGTDGAGGGLNTSDS